MPFDQRQLQIKDKSKKKTSTMEIWTNTFFFYHFFAICFGFFCLNLVSSHAHHCRLGKGPPPQKKFQMLCPKIPAVALSTYQNQTF